MKRWRLVFLSIALLANGISFAQTVRPRRATTTSGSGPLIRIGLMTDVSSVTLDCASPITVDPGRAENDRARPVEIPKGRVRIEIGRTKRSIYRVEALTTTESRRARKTADELRDEVDAAVSTEYDEEADRYIVLMGDFETKDEAEDVRDRLRRKGHRSARVVQVSQSSRQVQLVAYDADKQVASAAESIIVKAGDVLAEHRRSSVITKEVASRHERGAGVNAGAVPAASSGISPVRISDKTYRGEIHLVLNRRGRLNVVNVLSLEDYLRGVVPREISPSSFPQIEALKAQAVAARSYALARRAASAYHAEGFDLRDDARSQVYGGLSAEHPLTNRAVEETRGVVASHNGTPIEALYTSTCGGRTENNEAIFSSQIVPYLRSVVCAADESALRKHEMRSARDWDPEARSLAREYALLDVLGFSFPRRLTAHYLRTLASRDELLRWADRASQLVDGVARRPSPRLDASKLPGFAVLVSSAVYGESRPSMLLSPADVDYLLADLGDEQLPRESRADIAQLLSEGVLRLPPDLRTIDQFVVTRGFAVETFARALIGRLKSDPGLLRNSMTEPAERGRLIVASQARTGRKNEQTDSFEVEAGAWLFRRLGGQSYPVRRLVIIGGERAMYHVNKDGRVDFLEIEPADRGAASDRVSSAWYWQVRLSRADAQQRLARSRIYVGDLKDLVPVASGQSNRVTELDAIGSRGTARLRGSAVRTVLGLKESLFVIRRERAGESKGAAAFVFKGRGWGHGVGMCQTGAYGLAKEGYSFEAILRKYYTGIKLERIY